MGSNSPLPSLLLDIDIDIDIASTTTARKRNRNMERNMNRATRISQSTRNNGTAFAVLVLCCLVFVPSCTAFMVHPISKNSNSITQSFTHRSPAPLSFAVTGTRTRTGTATFKSMSIARKSQENDAESATTTTMNEDDDTPMMSFPKDDEELLNMQSQSHDQSTDSESNTRMAQLQRWSAPVQKMLDDGTGGWALSAANLAPDSHETINGKVFLATNIGYAVAGLVLTVRGDLWFGLMTDLAAIASFNYHYQQLLGSVPAKGSKPVPTPTMNNGGTPPPVQTPEMRLALLIDYIVASVSILTGAFYLWETGQMDSLPIEAVQVAVLSLGCLAACWVWEAGQPYMIFHSLWHLFSAYAGYLIGNTHQVAQQTVHHLL